MPGKAAIRAEAARLLARFTEAGAEPVEADILQPAETLLDLYGEDIRARAYVTADPLQGEMMLRPDFTVPVVQMHMAGGAEPARYAYAGEVFRRQEHRGRRAREYFQAGFELFARDDREAADAEVFALFAEVLAPLNLRPATGDIGILRAAIEGLSTSPARKAALLRHIWRPQRFRALLDRFGGRTAPPETRRQLIRSLTGAAPEDLIAAAGAPIGLREPAEIAARARALAEDALLPPVSGAEVDVLEDVLKLHGLAPVALAQLEDMAVDLPAIQPAVDRLARRFDAMAARGIDVDTLEFEASHGRSTLEYYDGFVFSFHAEARPELPPVATGGRYDALTRVLGQGREIPAVGGVIRPGLVVALREGTA